MADPIRPATTTAVTRGGELARAMERPTVPPMKVSAERSAKIRPTCTTRTSPEKREVMVIMGSEFTPISFSMAARIRRS